MNRARHVLAFALMAVAVAACSRDKQVDPPAELIDLQPTLRVERLWSASVAGDEPVLRLGLVLGAEGDRVFAAGRGGDIIALDQATGRTLWRTRTKLALSGGAGVGQGLVVAGTSDGEVVALEAADGRERWRSRVNGEVLAAPAVSAASVVVRTVDGRMHGLALADGRALWRDEQQMPRLTLRGTAPPVIAGELAVAGFDNGRVVAMNVRDGEIVWEAAVAPSRGRTELERLVDIDAPVRVLGQDVYMAGFQGRAAMLALDTGQIWWSRDLSSYRGLDVDDEALYVATADGDLVSLRRRTGVEIWRQDALKHRRLSAPGVVGDVVAVGDFEGYVHFFDRATGAPAARASIGGRVTAPPLVVGDTLIVMSDEGRIAAFRTQPLAARAARGETAAAPRPESP